MLIICSEVEGECTPFTKNKIYGAKCMSVIDAVWRVKGDDGGTYILKRSITITFSDGFAVFERYDMPETVYIITSGEYPDTSVVCVCLNKAIAEEIVKDSPDYEMEEMKFITFLTKKKCLAASTRLVEGSSSYQLNVRECWHWEVPPFNVSITGKFTAIEGPLHLVEERIKEILNAQRD